MRAMPLGRGRRGTFLTAGVADGSVHLIFGLGFMVQWYLIGDGLYTGQDFFLGFSPLDFM